MHKPKPVLETMIYKILWDFAIQTDYPNPVKRTNAMLVNKEKKKKLPENQNEEKQKYSTLIDN